MALERPIIADRPAKKSVSSVSLAQDRRSIMLETNIDRLRRRLKYRHLKKVFFVWTMVILSAGSMAWLLRSLLSH